MTSPAGGEREGWLASLWWRSGGRTLRGIHDYNRALHCSHCGLSLLSYPVHFFLLMMSFSCLARFPTNFRGVGVALCSQNCRERKGERKEGELNRKQRRHGTSPLCMINSCATGAATVSAGPVVLIMAVTQCADVTASQLWVFGCSCKLTNSPSGPVQAVVERERPAYHNVNHRHVCRENKGRVRQTGQYEKLNEYGNCCPIKKHRINSTHCHKV